MTTQNDGHVSGPLGECRAALLDGFKNRQPSSTDVDWFIDQFRGSFDGATANRNTWGHDRGHVLALARAIGAFAEFLATRDAEPAVTREELVQAYGILRGHCEPPQRAGRITIFGRYCTGYNPAP